MSRDAWFAAEIAKLCGLVIFLEQRGRYHDAEVFAQRLSALFDERDMLRNREAA